MKDLTTLYWLTLGILLNASIGRAQTSISLPAPEGPMNVGTISYYWVDSSRLDTITNIAYVFDKTAKVDTMNSSEFNAFRQMGIRIWYPAQMENDTEKAPYFPYLTQQEERPAFYVQTQQNYQNVETHAYWEAPIKNEKPYPVILFSTGRSTSLAYYTSLAEEFASQGYIFVGISSAHATHLGLPNAFIPSLRRWAPDFSIYEPSFEKADAFFEESNDLIAKDILFVIEQLKELNTSNPLFQGQVNMDKIGFMGHSMGGMAASRACSKTKICKAYLSIEGAPTKDVRESGLEVPSGLLVSEGSISFQDNSYRDIYVGFSKVNKSDFHLFTVSKSGHNAFIDLPIIATEQFNYEIEPLEGVSIGRKVSVAFFDQFLLGKRSRFSELSGQSELLTYSLFEGQE